MIPEFKEAYRWLSNFYPCKIIFEGKEYPSVEHAYQSAKRDDPSWKKFCQETESPGKVKREARKINIDVNIWDKKKMIVMESCLNKKFNQEPFRSMLLTTGDQDLQEGNNWGDTFWGVSLKTGQGQNHLGKLIMLKRDQLNQKVF